MSDCGHHSPREVVRADDGSLVGLCAVCRSAVERQDEQRAMLMGLRALVTAERGPSARAWCWSASSGTISLLAVATSRGASTVYGHGVAYYRPVRR